MTESDARVGGRSAQPPQQPSESDIRYNFRLLLIHGMLGQTGFRLLQAPTFLPTYLSLLAGNNAVVGIARAVAGARLGHLVPAPAQFTSSSTC